MVACKGHTAALACPRKQRSAEVAAPAALVAAAPLSGFARQVTIDKCARVIHKQRIVVTSLKTLRNQFAVLPWSNVVNSSFLKNLLVCNKVNNKVLF